jgi:iron complex transport system ATP-binding protein
MSDLLQADHLSFAYAATPVLREVQVQLSRGQIVMLIGPNGSGKSTLIKALLGLVRADGKVSWNGKDLSSWTRRGLARAVAYLPQSPTWQAHSTVGEVLRMGRFPYWGAFGIESQHDVRVLEETSDMLGIDDLLSRRMDEISGGQRQRIFIGRCLVQEPQAMLLDEPNTFLDLRHQVELGNLIRKLARERGIGILMASHDLNLAGAFADRLVLLDHGRIAKSGTVGEVLDPELLSRVYGVEIQRVDHAGKPVVLPAIVDQPGA